MTKQELVNKVYLRTDLNKVEVEKVVNQTLDEIKVAVATGQTIYLRGFGTWTPKLRKQKLARNISRGTPVIVQAHTVPFFKPSQEFKDLVAGK